MTPKVSTADLAKVGDLVYPIMLAEQADCLSEFKACELLGMKLEQFDESIDHAIASGDWLPAEAKPEIR